MRAKILLFFTLLFLCSCSVIEKPVMSEPRVESRIIGDVRRAETEIANLFGYAAWPFAPTEIEYSTNCRGAASYSYGNTILVSCDTPKYRQGKSFEKKNVFGEMEVFPGYTEYLDTISHEIAHIFFRSFIDPKDSQWKECDTEEYFELSEGFATYVAYEILLQESKNKNDYEYERYLAAKTARYLAQLVASDKQHTYSLLSDFPVVTAFSPESRQYIDSQLAYFLEKKSLVLKDEDVVSDWYPRGLMRVYALKHIFTKDGFKNGTIKKYFCV